MRERHFDTIKEIKFESDKVSKGTPKKTFRAVSRTGKSAFIAQGFSSKRIKLSLNSN